MDIEADIDVDIDTDGCRFTAAPMNEDSFQGRPRAAVEGLEVPCGLVEGRLGVDTVSPGKGSLTPPKKGTMRGY